MKYYSEKTGKLYDSLDDLTAAEQTKDKAKERRTMLEKECKALEKEFDEIYDNDRATEIMKQILEINREINEIDGVREKSKRMSDKEIRAIEEEISKILFGY